MYRTSLDHLRMPTVSAIISTYKRPKSLLRVLECLKSQAHTDFRDLDVVVVNDGSHQHGYEEIPLSNDDWPFEFTYYAEDRAKDDTPSLYSRKNFGVRATTGEVVLFLDDDLFFDEHTLFIIRLHHMFLANARPVLVPHYADKREPHHYQNPFAFLPQPLDWDKMRVWVSFAGLSLRRQDFEAVGGIDERYDGSMGFTDLDLGIMLYEDGCQVCQIDGACFFIDDAESDGSHRDQIIRRQLETDPHRNARLFVEKWGEHEAAKYGISYP